VRGLETAPLGADQAEQVAHVWRADECHDEGEALFTAEDFAALVKRPSCDLARHSIGVRDGARLVGVGLVVDEPESFVHVLPSHRGRGIGAWLLRWTQDAGRAAGHGRSDQSIAANAPAAEALLRADGFEPRWESWVFVIELDREPDPPRPPPGYSIRSFDPAGDDDRRAHRVIDDAFGEWPERDPWPFEDWAAQTLGRPGFSPENIALVEHGGDLVGAAVLVHEPDDGWVEQLAVARPHRGRGLARALLERGCGVTWRRGVRRFGLGTESRTGARGLYEHVGMRVRRGYTHYSKRL
jgi:GNAT superfamily N-acetyltransferase